ncbi:MAG: hypothetical protein WED27_13575 [Pirellulales bacterium]
MTVHLPLGRGLVLVLVAIAAATTGCTSVLSTASLQDIFGAGDNQAAEAAVEVADGDSQSALEDSADEAATDTERRAAAIDEAVSRLARLGHLDDAVRASLVATLKRTDQEDWPAVVEAFAESLPPGGIPAANSTAVKSTPADVLVPADADADADSEPPVHVVAKADLDSETTLGALPVEQPTAAPPVSKPLVQGDAVAAVVVPLETSQSPGLPEPAPATSLVTSLVAPPALAIDNASFASRVQGWGLLDRFAADRFRPGQDVIVYFELDGLSAGESAAGHTTCIDAVLRLVAEDGGTVHEWSFEPIAETCRAQRRDYFARYVVKIPAKVAAGPHRVALVVTDTLSGAVAEHSLPLEILPAIDQAD